MGHLPLSGSSSGTPSCLILPQHWPSPYSLCSSPDLYSRVASTTLALWCSEFPDFVTLALMLLLSFFLSPLNSTQNIFKKLSAPSSSCHDAALLRRNALHDMDRAPGQPAFKSKGRHLQCSAATIC